MTEKKTKTKQATKSAKAKPVAKAKKAKATNGEAKKLSAINAAAKVLAESKEPMEHEGNDRGNGGEGVLDESGGQDAGSDSLFIFAS